MLGYSHLFTPEDRRLLSDFVELDPLSQTLLAKMFFRKRVWYSSHHFKEYYSDETQIQNALEKLLSKGLISDTTGVLENPVKATIFLEALSSLEASLLSKELQKKLTKYPPVKPQYYLGFDAADLSSPLVVLKPFVSLKGDLTE